MLRFISLITRFTLILSFAFSTFSAKSQDVENGKSNALTPKDYGQWESLGFNRSFSEDGNWFYYGIRRNNDKNELRLHNLKNESVKILAEGARAQFSKDSKWFGYFINPTAAAKKKSKKPLRSDFRLLNLGTSDSLTAKDVNAFAFSDDGHFLAMKHYTPKGKKSKGGDLIVRNLQSGNEHNFGNVSEFSWQEDGTLLAMVIDADGKAGNGIQLFDVETGILKILDSHTAIYKGLKWRDESDDLAVFRSFKDEDYEDSTNHVLAWRGLASKKIIASVFDQKAVSTFPSDYRVANNRPLTWSDDGASIFYHIQDWTKKPVKSDSAKEDKPEGQDLTEEAPDLQIWHSNDVQVIPEQKRLAERKREDQYLSVWHLSNDQFVQLGNELTEGIRLQTDSKVLMGIDGTPYEKEAMFGRGNIDAYAIDILTGDRSKVLTKVNYIYDVNSEAQFLPYVSGKDYYVYDLKAGTSQNISSSLDASFVNQDDDHPTPNKRPYGFIAWEKGGDSFFVNSKYDVWQFWTNGTKSRRITNGTSEEIRHRFSYLDFEDFIDQKEALYLSTFGLKSKKSGYAKGIPGKEIESLIWQDARVTRLSKAKNADRYAFTSETFSDSPDYFTTSADFEHVEQLSSTNPFQRAYAWGEAELIEYTNAKGEKLQGSLFYPANYERGKKYPMITYIYEKLSDGIHSYGMPSQRNYYSHGVFTQEGYFVLRPDIVFDAGDPGISSVRTMEAAVKAVVNKGLVDEKRVGLIGHSWGGYQAGYAVTQTDIFAASVAGAGLTNLTSMWGMIAWAFGGAPESAHFEVSQERMMVPPYKDVESYIRNSSVFNVEKLNTPLLFEVGDADQNVDWRQGIEYYNAARRARKQFVLLVYAKEGHGLRQDKNRSDYQMRILKWFGHYLKGDSIEPWMENGIPYEEQMKTLKDWKK